MAVPDIPYTSGLPQVQSPVSWLNALNNVTGSLGDLGSILGNQARGDAQGQVAQGQLDNAANSNLINLYRSQQDAQNQAAQLDLERQQFGTTNRGQTAKQALIGALLGGGYQPTHVSVPGIQTANIGGGLASSLLSNPQTRAAMQTLFSKANNAQNTPLSFTGGNLVNAPTLTPVTKIQTGAAGKTGGFLQDLAGIGKVAATVLPFLF